MKLQVDRLVAICCSFNILVVSQITRLPDCMYHGDFKIHNGKRFQGTVAETHSDITDEQCIRKCFANNDCLFINHKKDNSNCELFTLNSGSLTDNDEWAHLSPDYSDPSKVGPSCVPNSPCDNPNDVCLTICEDPGFKCISTNVATTSKATATHSTEFDVNIWPASAGIDLNDDTFSSTRNEAGFVETWWKVELDKIYRIFSVYVNLGVTVNPGYLLQVSTDDVTYVQCGVLDGALIQTLPCVKQAKFVRLYHHSKNGMLQVQDFQVYVDINDIN